MWPDGAADTGTFPWFLGGVFAAEGVGLWEADGGFDGMQDGLHSCIASHGSLVGASTSPRRTDCPASAPRRRFVRRKGTNSATLPSAPEISTVSPRLTGSARIDLRPRFPTLRASRRPSRGSPPTEPSGACFARAADLARPGTARGAPADRRSPVVAAATATATTRLRHSTPITGKENWNSTGRKNWERTAG